MFNQATIKGKWFERDLRPAVPRGALVEVVSAAPIAEVLTNKARRGELMFVKNHCLRLVDQLEALVQAPVAKLTVLRRRKVETLIESLQGLKNAPGNRDVVGGYESYRLGSGIVIVI
jgi:hypothetical protein